MVQYPLVAIFHLNFKGAELRKFHRLLAILRAAFLKLSICGYRSFIFFLLVFHFQPVRLGGVYQQSYVSLNPTYKKSQ
jgi:hypothetical protein